MIKPIQLGSRSFPLNLVQGPLAGVSCAPFRKLVSRYSRPAFTCTEMISCQTLIHQSAEFLRRFTHKDPEEAPVCFQLSGNRPAELAAAVSLATKMGADLIDLNCGCPVKKIRSKKSGSRLLSEPGRLFELMTSMKQHTTVPVSIKIRVDADSGDAFNRDVATAVNDAGIDFLVVHGRHWTEDYDVTCRYDEIAFFANEVKVPVIGNGDIASVASLRAMQATGCAGMMISRATVGEPWLIRRLAAELNGEPFQPPDWHEVGAIFIEHVSGFATLLGSEKFALLHARKLAKYYSKKHAGQKEFCKSINLCATLDDFSMTCRRFFQSGELGQPG